MERRERNRRTAKAFAQQRHQHSMQQPQQQPQQQQQQQQQQSLLGPAPLDRGVGSATANASQPLLHEEGFGGGGGCGPLSSLSSRAVVRIAVTAEDMAAGLVVGGGAGQWGGLARDGDYVVLE
jgi:hypothetical protein